MLLCVAGITVRAWHLHAAAFFLEYRPTLDRFVLIMEDLTARPEPCEQIDQIAGLQADEAARLVSCCASLHGRFLGRVRSSGFGPTIRTQGEPNISKRM